jgi:hypothetical protein
MRSVSEKLMMVQAMTMEKTKPKYCLWPTRIGAHGRVSVGAGAACASEPLLDGQKVIRFSQAAHA